MKLAEIRKLPTKSLTEQSTKIREEIADMRRQYALGEIQNTRGIRNKRKELARILTVLSEELVKETK
ncbi:MAG TPA: 50S ribosomal protein L29 [Candidatus Saccharibacteria bacterium]|nr:50S ribosomal protein L29 [Candidatus Saccharibacteria bacterium]